LTGSSDLDYLVREFKSKKGPYQTIILLLEKTFQFSRAEIMSSVCDSLPETLTKSGTFWCFVQDYFNSAKNRYELLTFKLMEEINDARLTIKNCIVRFKPQKNLSRILLPYYDNIIMCSKHPSDYVFNKDKIREEHIWKEAEWGGGRRSRYNPKGKDPSNFWIKTDSSRGKITGYYGLNDLEAIQRILLASCSHEDSILLVFDSLEELAIQKLSEYENMDTIEVIKPRVISKRLETANLQTQSMKKVNVSQVALNDVKIYYKSSESMDEIDDEVVQTIVTSPPYWGLRDYDHQGQIGYDESYETYRERLIRVWRECFRILSPSGVIWVNINKRIVKGQYLNIPYDCAKDLRTAGFTPLDILIWHRPISVPGYGEKNLADRYEVILLFAKNQTNCYLNKSAFESDDYAPSYVEHGSNVWKMFRKIGNIGKTIKAMIKECGLKHTAMFPEELPRRAILLSSQLGDYVLDPFLGSGTTVSVAKELGRHAIGYEINTMYRPIIQFRLKSKPAPMDAFFGRKT